jgi:septal ring factor EnvC (AmiA/AmiB activator)
MNGDLTNEPTKDLTENLSDRQLLVLLLERVTAIGARVARLEQAEEDRQRETRPLWERLEGQMAQVFVKFAAIEERLTAIENEQRRMRIEIGLLREDLYQEKMQRGYLAERVTDLENQQRQPA